MPGQRGRPGLARRSTGGALEEYSPCTVPTRSVGVPGLTGDERLARPGGTQPRPQYDEYYAQYLCRGAIKKYSHMPGYDT